MRLHGASHKILIKMSSENDEFEQNVVEQAWWSTRSLGVSRNSRSRHGSICMQNHKGRAHHFY